MAAERDETYAGVGVEMERVLGTETGYSPPLEEILSLDSHSTSLAYRHLGTL